MLIASQREMKSADSQVIGVLFDDCQSEITHIWRRKSFDEGDMHPIPEGFKQGIYDVEKCNNLIENGKTKGDENPFFRIIN